MRYFSNLFSSTHEEVPYEDLLDGCLTQKLIEEQLIELVKPFLKAKVLYTLKEMHPKKAPRPDSCHAIFYQQYWGDVGPEVLALVLGYLNNEVPMDALNETFIVLIPKINN